jgi:alanyl-tRNA synthetase (EC 6.1.1.7)
MGKMATKLKDKGRAPTVEELITLYESDGITPEYLKEVEVISRNPIIILCKIIRFTPIR